MREREIALKLRARLRLLEKTWEAAWRKVLDGRQL